MRHSVAAIVLATSLLGCERSSETRQQPSPADAAAAPKAVARSKAPRGRDLAIDGIRLGDRYGSTVMSRDPYREPCDDDGIENQRRRAMVYGGRPCREHAFPDETTVVFLLDWAERDDFDQPIRTMGWMGGHHFDSLVDLPADIGEPVDRVRAAWGAPAESFTLGMLEYDRYGDELFVMIQRATVVGFVVGEMPADHTAESWEVFDEMYRKYTPRLPSPDDAVSRADCEKVLRKAFALSGGDATRFEAKLQGEIDECVAEAPPEAIQCALAATTMDELDRCK